VVDADVHARDEADPLGLHLGHAQVDVALVELEVGDPEAQQSADARALVPYSRSSAFLAMNVGVF